MNFTEIQKALTKDINHLVNVTVEDESNIINVIACLKTISSSLRIKADKLTKIKDSNDKNKS